MPSNNPACPACTTPMEPTIAPPEWWCSSCGRSKRRSNNTAGRPRFTSLTCETCGERITTRRAWVRHWGECPRVRRSLASVIGEQVRVSLAGPRLATHPHLAEARDRLPVDLPGGEV